MRPGLQPRGCSCSAARLHARCRREKHKCYEVLGGSGVFWCLWGARYEGGKREDLGGPEGQDFAQGRKELGGQVKLNAESFFAFDLKVYPKVMAGNLLTRIALGDNFEGLGAAHQRESTFGKLGRRGGDAWLAQQCGKYTSHRHGKSLRVPSTPATCNALRRSYTVPAQQRPHRARREAWQLGQLASLAPPCSSQQQTISIVKLSK